MSKKVSEIVAGDHSPDLHTLLTHVRELTFNALPETYKTHEVYHYFDVTVSYRGHDLWAVTVHNGSKTLCREDVGVIEPLPSSRDAEYLSAHRFSFLEAVKLAEKAQHTVKMVGKTASEWVGTKEQG